MYIALQEIKEIQIDSSVETTVRLDELKNTKDRLGVTNEEILHSRTELDRAATEVNLKEIIITGRETEIAELTALLKEKGDTLKIKESEPENKEKYIEELEDKNQQLAESVKKFESIYKELESAKQQSAQIQENIKKLADEKQGLKVRVGTLESYINKGKINNEQQQKVLEDIRRMMEGTY